jgi:ubiquinone/menaquinone biosynthesis C-methylase UbiE
VTEQEEWESAYLRFETPEQEFRKFRKRLRKAGVDAWEKHLEVLELFCGRGSGLRAWQAMGFPNLSGLDLSRRLLEEYDGPGRLLHADARAIPIGDSSRDIVSVQGGLHHLENLRDVDQVLSEIYRVLRPKGRLLVVEPWSTPFLTGVHAMCRQSWARRLSVRLDSLARMIRLEEPLYSRWLSASGEIRRLLEGRFEPVFTRERWGKLMFLGVRR